MNSKTERRTTVKVGACQVPEFWQKEEEAISCINDYASKAQAEKAGVLCFPECFLQGYLTRKEEAEQHAIDLSSAQFQVILEKLSSTPMLVIGLIERFHGHLYNSAIVIHHKKLIGVYRKTNLMDGERIFEPGISYPVFESNGLRFGINICYDTNFPGAAMAIATQGANLIVCCSNTMMGKLKSEKLINLHNEVRAQRCRETGLWMISSDIRGERDGKVAYGPTAVINPDGIIIDQLPLLSNGIVWADIPI